MTIKAELSKTHKLKVEQINQFAQHLNINLDKAEEPHKKIIEEAIALFKTGIPIAESCQQVMAKAKEVQAKAKTPALITKLAEIYKLKVEQIGQFAQHLKVDADKATDSQVQSIEEAIALFKTGIPIEESCQQVMTKAKETQAKTKETQTKSKKTKDKAKETQTKAKETSNSEKFGGAIVQPQTSKIDRESIPEMGEDHQGFMETIDGVTDNAAKDKGPDLRGAIATEINETGENLINAARNYAGYSMNQALAREMNSPEFLEQLRKEIKAGKSQTSANN